MSVFGSAATTASTSSIAPTDFNVPQAGNDGISSLNWSPTANILVSSNWDSGVRCWEAQTSGTAVQAVPKAQVNHENASPVLDTCFSADGTKVFSCGIDKTVRQWNLGAGNTTQQIGAHDAPVQGVCFLSKTNIVVSGGWDRKLKFWDLRTPNPVLSLDLPERVYAMDCQESLLAVGTADRQIIAYDVTGAPREIMRKESPLKYQTRCISCFPDNTGFAIGSIEGRVGIHYVHKVPGRESFAFKCHRQDTNVYSVNDISFNKQCGTFCTVGSDGIVNFWDKDNKQRLKGFTALPRPVSAAAFNAQSNLFAYASSYDWSKGSAHVIPGNEIFIHYVDPTEIQPKSKKSGFKR